MKNICNTESKPATQRPEAPINEPNTDALPSALVFYLSWSDRKQILRTLKAHHHDRAIALLRALGIDDSFKQP